MHLTVVMSVLNGEKYLREAVESILNQTYLDFTFIIINNGSSDNTGWILEEYSRKDSRIKIVTHTETVPLVEARMKGLQMAETEWVAWMDADDISEPARLEKQVEVIKQYHDRLGAVGTWARYINEEGKILGNRIGEPVTPEKFFDLYSKNQAIALVDPSAIVHRPTFLKLGGYRPECTPAGDLDLWYRIAEKGKLILVVPEFLIKYRVHTGSDSVRKTMLQRQKTHFINYNMRRRRSGLPDMEWDTYIKEVWSSPLYRIPRLRTDLAMTLYKRAGLYFGAGRYVNFLVNLLSAGILKPSIVFKRILSQKLSSSLPN